MCSMCNESLPGIPARKTVKQFNEVMSFPDNPFDVILSSRQSKEKWSVKTADKAQECFRWLGFVEQVLK